MFYLSKSTASQKVLVYLVDATDGYTPETGVSTPTIKISKAAGVGNAPNDGTFAELDSTDLPGWYSVQLDATDTDTLGALAVDVVKSGTSRHFVDRGVVLPTKVYDSLFGGTDNLEVDAIQVGGTTQTGRDIGASVLLAADQAVNVTKWGGTAVASAYVQANTVQFAGQTITCAGGVTIPAATLASTTGAVGSVTAAVTLTADYDAAKTAATQTSVNTIDDFLDTEIAAILAAVDTEVAAIKAKTDNLPASPAAVGSAMTLANDAITAAVIANGAIDAATFAADVDAEAAAWIWNAATASYGTSGTYGEALEAVGAAADPWLTNLPGAYGSGTAGYIIGTNLNATVSSRSSQTSVDTIDDFLDTEMAAVLAAVDTEVAAIKAKTDNLPASPAAVGSAMTLANDSITADAIAAGGANEIADALLNRDMSTGADDGSATVRTPRQALRFLRNKWSVSGTTLTVCKENDSTASWTAEVTTDAAADPITASDPASS